MLVPVGSARIVEKLSGNVITPGSMLDAWGTAKQCAWIVKVYLGLLRRLDLLDGTPGIILHTGHLPAQGAIIAIGAGHRCHVPVILPAGSLPVVILLL